MRQRLSALAKLAVSVSIVAYLIYDVQSRDPQTFVRLRDDPKDWRLLAAAWACFVAGLWLGWMRWRTLARGLDLRMSARDAIRLGFFGYLLDFLALGTIGGDVARGVMVGRENGKRWAEALASVVTDRFVGLWALSVAAAVAVAVGRPGRNPELATLTPIVFAAAAASSVGLGLMMVARVRDAVLSLVRSAAPRLAAPAARVVDALRAYGDRNRVFVRAAAMSLGVPLLNVTGIYLTARSLPLAVPTLAEHFVIVPPAMLAGAVPLPMEALGVFEYVLNTMYAQALPAGAPAGAGLLVALTYRALTVATILVGAPIYVWARGGAADTAVTAAAARDPG